MYQNLTHKIVRKYDRYGGGARIHQNALPFVDTSSAVCCCFWGFGTPRGCVSCGAVLVLRRREEGVCETDNAAHLQPPANAAKGTSHTMPSFPYHTIPYLPYHTTPYHTSVPRPWPTGHATQPARCNTPSLPSACKGAF